MEKYAEVCGDNRFKLIKKYKDKLIEGTNIEHSKEEMDVIDNILFRFWQMGWLDKLEANAESSIERKCANCKYYELSSHDMPCDICEDCSHHEYSIVQSETEVAREIFEEIEKTIMNTNWTSQNYKEWYFGELKKKYIGE